MNTTYEDDLKKLDELHESCSQLPELCLVINGEWKDRVRETIVSIGSDRKYADGCFWFFKCLTDNNSFPWIEFKILDKKLQEIEKVARKQNKLRDYRETRGKLACSEENQIIGALFEILVVAKLIEENPIEIELYPKVNTTNANVEARMKVKERFVYIEVKAIGSSKYDPHGCGSHSIDSMIQQIRESLNSKLGVGKQLHSIVKTEPTVICLGLGSNADTISGSWGVNEYLDSNNSNISRILLMKAPVWKCGLQSFSNEKSTLKLTSDEISFFESALSTSY